MRSSSLVLLAALLGSSHALSIGDRPAVVVAGATGRVGSAVVRSLVRRDEVDVVALVRNADKARKLFEADKAVTIAEADYADVDAIDSAILSSVRELQSCRMFVACSNGPDQAQLEANLCAAAARRGAEYAVKLSTVTPVLEMKEGGPYAAHLEAEAALAASGVPYSILRPNLFMQMLSAPGLLGFELGDATSAEVHHCFAEASISLIDARDVGEVAAALLCLPPAAAAEHHGQTYRLSGPAAEKVGDELLAAAAPLWARRDALPTLVGCTAAEHVSKQMPSLPAPAAASLEGFLRVLAEECDEVTDCVERLSGKPPTPFRAFVTEHAPAFLPATYRRLLGTPAASFREGAVLAELPMSEMLGDHLGESEVLIKVLVAGVNGGADTFRVTNAEADATDFPLGSEGAGVVVACGSGVAANGTYSPGQRVCFLGGGYSEYVRLPAAMCFAAPPPPSPPPSSQPSPPPSSSPSSSPSPSQLVDPAELVALRISGLTAAVALGRTREVQEGDVVVVTAACGATGSFAVQEAAARGATVVGTVGSDEKAEAARALGVSRVVNYKREDLGEVLRSEFGGGGGGSGGVDVAYEGVGGPLLKAVVDNLAEGGAVLMVGSISQYPHNGPDVPAHGIEGLPPSMEVFRAGKTVALQSGGGRTVVGNVWGDAFGSVEADGTRTLTAVRERLYARHAAGKLVALVDDARPGAPRFDGVGAAVEAVEHMLSGRNVGKAVVRVSWDA